MDSFSIWGVRGRIGIGFGAISVLLTQVHCLERFFMARNFRLLTKVLGALALIALSSSPALAGLSFPAAAKKDGSPDRRRGAGSRNPDCLVGETSEEKNRTLFSMLPQTNTSLTTDAHPEFFWYTPPLNTKARVEFTLARAGDNGEPIYASTFISNGEEGIARLSLPTGMDGMSLEIDQTYIWSVQLTCLFPEQDHSEQSPLGRLDSTIQRVALSDSVESQLKVASRLGQAEVYAQNGFWNDSLSALANVQCNAATRDQSLSAWGELFKSVELDYFTQIPLLDDCDCTCQ